MFQADNRNIHKPQDRSRWLLAAVWHTTNSDYSAPQWSNSTCNAPTQLYRVSKKQSMKADLTIYSHAVDAPVQYMSESLILGHNLDFSSCDILVGFCKSSHISVSSCTSTFKAAMSLRSSKRTSFGRRSINPSSKRTDERTWQPFKLPASYCLPEMSGHPWKHATGHQLEFS